MKNQDKYRGCLLGGAAGDALGYVVEFLRETDIIIKYGVQGITEYDLQDGVAKISDDTQMTLFTATGLLTGSTRGKLRGSMANYTDYIALSYQDWYKTQTMRYPCQDGAKHSWLLNVPELFARRAPGNSCLSAIKSGKKGTMQTPINDSKGCGGVMRVAPIGLYFAGEEYEKRYPLEWIDQTGAEVAALTHGHSLGYIPAAALVHMIQLVAHDDTISLSEAVKDMQAAMEKQFAGDEYLPDFLDLVNLAVALSADETVTDRAAIKLLGEGWVAEETLAIALYCALKYSDDFDKALIASVNHNGDSDSTGAVTGNILGAYLGLSGIPQKYLEHLELKDVILELADDLYHDCQRSEETLAGDEVWLEKYSYMTWSVK